MLASMLWHFYWAIPRNLCITNVVKTLLVAYNAGYGFVMFEKSADAMRACWSLQQQGFKAQFAKIPQVHG